MVTPPLSWPGLRATRPRWRPVTVAGAPCAMRRWLATRGSLTAALERTAPSLEVRLLGNGWRIPFPDERVRLGMAARQQAWIREVYLEGSGARRVFARTVAPAAAVAGPLRWLPLLGEQPLGTWLFRGTYTGRRARRRGVEVASLEWPGFGPEAVWARRSVLDVGGHCLLITEVFDGQEER